MAAKFHAHIRLNQNNEAVYETVREHVLKTSEYAGEALKKVGLSKCAVLAGLLHDMGKCTGQYQEYLQKAVFKGNVVRGSVNHTFAGTRYVLSRYHDAEKWGVYAPLTAEVLSYAIGAHHGQFDVVGLDHHSGFRHRLEQDIPYDEAVRTYLNQCVCESAIDKLFREAVQENEDFFKRLVPLLGQRKKPIQEGSFYTGLASRLILSALIEGDHRSTAEFMEPGQTEKIARIPSFRWTSYAERVDEKLETFPKNTILQQARREISLRCKAFAERKSGIYRLNVPTGAGKTLSSLRYALRHAAVWNKSRIIFTVPLLSILDQNAAVIRDFIGDDRIVLEHHSNVIQEDAQEKAIERSVLEASWEAPIIITTMVQLLNTMFDGRIGCTRRFHALCDSVIIIDEVQTIPAHLLSLFHLAISFLSEACGATVVLCSATQPCAEATTHPIAVGVSDIVPFDDKLWRAFQRTQICNAGAYRLEDIPARIVELLENTQSLLAICNSKSEAEYLYQNAASADNNCFYLSASMCMAHRRAELAAMRKKMLENDGKRIVCISTQVIEAGVDISFERVVRLSAGMESIVQAAGRCNRNGECKGIAVVQVVQVKGENLQHLPDIKRGKEATQELFLTFANDPSRFDNELISDKAIEYYYRKLYGNMPEGMQDGVASVQGCRTSLMTMLSDNADFVDVSLDQSCEQYCLRQAFKTAGRQFSVFDSNAVDVLVPWQRGRELIEELSALSLPADIGRMKELLKEAPTYSVSVYEWQRKKLEQESGIVSICDGAVLVMQEGFYDDKTGVRAEKGEMSFLEI